MKMDEPTKEQVREFLEWFPQVLVYIFSLILRIIK